MSRLTDELTKLIPESDRPDEGDDAYKMAEILGWNNCVLEMNKRLVSLILEENKLYGQESQTSANQEVVHERGVGE